MLLTIELDREVAGRWIGKASCRPSALAVSFSIGDEQLASE